MRYIMNYTNFSRKNMKFMRMKLSKLHGKILDVGGADFIDQIGFIPGDDYICLDIKKTKNTSILCDAHAIPFKNESFDYVICNAVLEHTKTTYEILCEINRILRSGGHLWVSVPFLQHIHSDPYDFRRFTNYGLSQEIELAGFDVKEIHGSYGIIDSIEYLLYAGLVYKIKDKSISLINVFSLSYLIILIFLFILIKIVGLIFSFMQDKDLHHATSFTIIAEKNRGYEIV